MLKGKINFKFSGAEKSEEALQKVDAYLLKMFEEELEHAKKEIDVDWIGLEIKTDVQATKVSGYATVSLDLPDDEECRKTFNCLMNGLSGWTQETLATASIVAGSSYAAVEMWCDDVSDSQRGHNPDSLVVPRKKRWYDFLFRLGREK